ncbi:B3/B4 domain-containing protein [Rhodovibrionaceae bacterium A322]
MVESTPISDHFSPIIDNTIFDLRPDFRLVSITVSGFDWSGGDGSDTEEFVRAAEAGAALADPERDAHLTSWKDAYRAFGAKPKRTPCSAEALLKRVIRDGELPRINPLVDVYNAVSILHGLPVGGEDRSLYSGLPRLTRATGDEPFVLTKEGAEATEYPSTGEVVWRDDLGVTCRRWNWRQGTRTRILPGASDLWFILEALDGLSDGRLDEALSQFTTQINQLSPGARLETHRLDAKTSPGA